MNYFKNIFIHLKCPFVVFLEHMLDLFCNLQSIKKRSKTRPRVVYILIDVYKTYIVGTAQNVLSNVEAITDCSFYSFYILFLTNVEKKENYIFII